MISIISERLAETRLATYGTLAADRVNHHRLAGLAGRWFNGTVRGTLVNAGCGASFGYPGLILDPLTDSVGVFVFESADLPNNWARLDEFEGYRRVTTQVLTEDG